ncbi:hypothetical protein BG011_006475 [Mortierella polycephala]|uniref:Uncharacterized protein n=1 Tax=Mortierella polycephala TaxID=41804 RepID=A0A9P6U8Z4_9FUNG|nr:hypothetical protein BG011_006475 [Mortierella polycephala]
MEDIVVSQPKRLTDTQMSTLVSLWRLSHYKQAPCSSWSILYSQQRRPKRRSRSPMICFDTATYELLKKQQEEELMKKQIHRHQIWQHVQDRLAEQNKILEQEMPQSKKSKKQQLKAEVAMDGISTTTSGSSTTASPKRSIRWGLQNNMTKRFDKTVPLTLVPVPAIDKRPTKSALKVRTTHTIQNHHHHSKTSIMSSKTKTTTTTTTRASSSTTTTTASGNTKNDTNAGAASDAGHSVSARMHAMDFF